MSGQRHANLRPVIELASSVEGLMLRASTDRNCVFLAFVHSATDAAASVSAHMSEDIRRAGDNGLQIGSVVFFLAPAEADRFFTWLRTSGDTSDGES